VERSLNTPLIYFFIVIKVEKKKCNICGRVLPLNKFSKNKNNKDNLSYYCRDCTKEQKNLYFYEKGNEHYEETIINKLKQYSDIKIEGIDYDKVVNTRVTMYDIPGVFNNLLYDLPIFLRKYNFTFEEYKFFIQQCKKNKFWIEPKV